DAADGDITEIHGIKAARIVALGQNFLKRRVGAGAAVVEIGFAFPTVAVPSYVFAGGAGRRREIIAIPCIIAGFYSAVGGDVAGVLDIARNIERFGGVGNADTDMVGIPPAIDCIAYINVVAGAGGGNIDRGGVVGAD